MTEEKPLSANKIIAGTEDQRGKKVRISAVRRVIKNKNVSKNISKFFSKIRDEKKFWEAQEEIVPEEQLGKDEEIVIYQFGEAGFFLRLCITYAWQPGGGYMEIFPDGG